MNYLVDTNVVCEQSKPRPNMHVMTWLGTLDSVAVSAITLEEISFGIERSPPQSRDRLRRWFGDLMHSGVRIVPISSSIAIHAGRMRATHESLGRRATQADTLIAASAVSEGLILATRNTRDFEYCGVALFNPFL